MPSRRKNGRKKAEWLKKIQQTVLDLKSEKADFQDSGPFEFAPKTDEVLAQKQSEVDEPQSANTLYAGRLRQLAEKLADAEKKLVDLEQQKSNSPSDGVVGV